MKQLVFFKHRYYCRLAVLLLTSMFFVACNDAQRDSASTQEAQSAVRWYDAAELAMGSEVFSQNCALCHGDKAQGLVADWRQKLPDGSFPPPPLNGTAHAWHHPRSVLLQVIENGGAEFGGQMPSFASVLNAEQKLAAIAYFQSFWSEDIYQQWMQMGGTN